MQVYFLEIVIADVDVACASYAAVHNIEFSKPVAELGNARTAKLANGGMISVRAPMHEQENPAVRPYWLVKDAQAALDAVVANGATIAHPVLEIPAYGHFAIYEQGGVMQGFWQMH